MTSIESIALEVSDPTDALAFNTAAFGVGIVIGSDAGPFTEP